MAESGYRKRSIRLSQAVVPFGVGGIYDFRGESLLACDINEWRDSDSTRIEAPKLAASLQIQEIRQPRVTANDQRRKKEASFALPYMRFPRWTFCPSCRRMHHLSGERREPLRVPRCTCEKRSELVPMRFIVICENGHLEDYPWFRLAHLGTAKRDGCSDDTLEFVSNNAKGNKDSAGNADSPAQTGDTKGYGLDTLGVMCSSCKSRQTLRGITDDSMSRKIGLKCHGKQPWQYGPARECDVNGRNPPAVVQRGASNVYFAEVRSSIEIPDEKASDPEEEKLRVDPYFAALKGDSIGIRDQLMKLLTAKYKVTAERLLQLLERQVGGTVESLGSSIGDDEWAAFISDRPSRHRFLVTRPLNFSQGASAGEPRALLAEFIRSVVAVDRLREVRALAGFRRLKPSAKFVSASLGGQTDWRPGVEIFGEGLFIAFDETAMQKWENSSTHPTSLLLENRRKSSLFGERLLEIPVTPRFLLLHTLAHLLIRELAFASGYAASSLRERIYSKTPDQAAVPQAGLLIYTAAGDAEGTLGGLARQASPERLSETILATLQRGFWCSQDPVCRESKGQGFNALNLGSCHACTLLAETSCAHGNAFLDRNALFGSNSLGLFDTLIGKVLDLSASR